MSGAEFSQLGEYFDAEQNWFEASVHEEIAAQLGMMGIELGDTQVDELAWGVAAELYYRWKVAPKGPVPPEHASHS